MPDINNQNDERLEPSRDAEEDSSDMLVREVIRMHEERLRSTTVRELGPGVFSYTTETYSLLREMQHAQEQRAQRERSAEENREVILISGNAQIGSERISFEYPVYKNNHDLVPDMYALLRECEEMRLLRDNNEGVIHHFRTKLEEIINVYMPKRKTVECSECKIKASVEKSYVAGIAKSDSNRIFCADCIEKYCKYCYECGNFFVVKSSVKKEEINFMEVVGGKVCLYCFDNHYAQCEVCPRYDKQEDMHTLENENGREENVCRICYEERMNEDSIPYRSFSTGNTFLDTTPGIYITSPRIFSCEIECIGRGKKLAKAARALPKEIGVTNDGSLYGDGLEFQTPKLSGKKGEALVETICDTLLSHGAKVDARCGMHIHLEGKDTLKLDIVKNLWAFYLAAEETIISFLPRDRRVNGYCRLLRPAYQSKEIKTAKTLDELEAIWYRACTKTEVNMRKGKRYEDTRYFGVNIHSLLSHGHIEIRFHSGTLNSKKILEWVNLHQRILDFAVQGKIKNTQESYLSEQIRLEDKTTALFDILQLSPQSRAYFLKRQEKFLQKTNPLEETLK